MIKPVYYLQGDSKWGSNNYSAKGESKTIKSSGCGPTSAAMILQTLMIDMKITPADTAKWSMANGYKALNQGTFYTYFKPQFAAYGITCSQMNNSNLYKSTSDTAKKVRKEVKSLLKTPGYFVIAVMGVGNWTGGGHYVVAWKVDDLGNVYINDPASSGNGRNGIPRTKAPFDTWAKEVKYFWKVKYGTQYKAKNAGYLYSKKSTSKKYRTSVIPMTGTVWHIKDLKDGWSIVTDGVKVGYCKNNILNAVGLSSYKKTVVKTKTNLRNKPSTVAGKKLFTLEPGTKLTIIYKGKKWARVKYVHENANHYGYVLLSKLFFEGC